MVKIFKSIRKRNAEGLVCPVLNSLGSHYATHRLDLPPSQAVVLMLFHQIVGILHPQCLMILDVTVQSCKNIVLYQFLYRPVLYDCELFYQGCMLLPGWIGLRLLCLKDHKSSSSMVAPPIRSVDTSKILRR